MRRALKFLVFVALFSIFVQTATAFAQEATQLALLPFSRNNTKTFEYQTKVRVELKSAAGVPQDGVVEMYKRDSSPAPLIRHMVNSPIALSAGLYDIRVVWRSRGRFYGLWKRNYKLVAGEGNTISFSVP